MKSYQSNLLIFYNLTLFDILKLFYRQHQKAVEFVSGSKDLIFNTYKSLNSNSNKQEEEHYSNISDYALDFFKVRNEMIKSFENLYQKMIEFTAENSDILATK